MSNSLMSIAIYRIGINGWAFDDSRRNIISEPFVSGAPQIIDALAAKAGLPSGRQRLRLTFSAEPFPGMTGGLDHIREEYGGNWYSFINLEHSINLEGWLCPTLFAYFKTAPKKIYVSVERGEGEK